MTTCCKKLGLELTELAYLSRPHLRIAGQLFVIHARDFDVDVAAVQERAADFLLVVGDSSATALFDGVAVEATGAGVRVAVAPSRIRYCSTLDDMA
jgi:hypothetical protein